MAAVSIKNKIESKASSLLDSRKEMIYPQDFSFKAMSSFSDIRREKPRPRDGKAVLDLTEEDIVPDSSVELVKIKTTALRLNNNMLSSWDKFTETIQALYIEPHLNMQWLDLSFNDLKTIDECLLQLPNLTMLYFHGNNIRRIREVDKLSSLHRLKSLSIHGNPIESVDGYRQYVITKISQLQTLDFSGITKADRKTCDVWSKIQMSKDLSNKSKTGMTDM